MAATLLPTDFESGAWHRIAAWAQEQLAAARERNDAPASEADTALTRGEIRALKRLLGLPEEVARAREAEAAVDSSFGGSGPNGSY